MADDPRTGGMIALVPTAEDAERLAVEGGDDPDALHLTLVHLGDDVTGWDEAAVDGLTASLDEATTALGGPMAARVMGHAQFNPDGGPDGDMDPCAVYLVGDAQEVGPLRDSVLDLLAQHGLPVAEQHSPFLPHITGGYGIDTSVLGEAGPVTFDRLRLALGDQEIDVPLGEPLTELGDDYETPEPVPVDEVEVKTAPTPPARVPRVEVKVASPDPRAARLRAYWAHGQGLAKWYRGPGVPGSFRRLRALLAKYVQGDRILNGLTANIYHEATGTWPGRRGNKSLPAAEFKSLWDYDDPDADTPNDDEHAMCAGIDAWGQEFLDRADDVEDPDGDPDGGLVPAMPESKAAPPVGMVTIPAADLPPDLFTDDDEDPDVIYPDAEPSMFDELDDVDPDGVDRLMLDADAAIIADVVGAGETDEEDDWTDVASRDKRYRLGGDAVLEQVDDDEHMRHAPPAALR